MRTKIHLFFIFFSSIAFSQQEKFQINWNDEKQYVTHYGAVTVPGFNDANFVYETATNSIYYVTQWDIQNSRQSFDLTNVIYQPVSNSLLNNLNLELIPTELDYRIQVTKARDEAVAVLQMNPFVKENGAYKRVVSFEIASNNTNRQTSNFSNSSVGITNSVLATGNWYRFYVEKTGVHKISRDFLSSLGIDVENVDPRKIKIYSHGGAMLPLKNEDNLFYDLPQNKIKVIGEQDGSFDEEDYILFYGTSTKGYNEESVTHINAFADRSYYYINVEGQNGERITNAAEPSGEPNFSIDTFDDYQFYEVDEYNIAKLGRRWFGDRFNVQNQRTYSFEFENLISSQPIQLKILAAATADVTTSLSVSANGNMVGNLQLESMNDSNLARGDVLDSEFISNAEQINISLNYNNGGVPSSTAYLDFISLEAKRLLRIEDEQLHFTFKDAATMSGIGVYTIQNASEVLEVWDVSNITNIASIPNQNSDQNFSFKANLGEAREYVAVLPSDLYTPQRESNPRVANQNLKGIFYNNQNTFEDIDYLLFSTGNLMPQAERLANHRRQNDGLNVKVIDVEQVYNEFSSGKQDIAAIRNFIKYVYDNASSPDNRLKYVGLFGDGSVDYKQRLQNNNNIVPAFESYESFNISSSYVTDDFYGMMDPNEGSMEDGNLVDIAIGRMLVDNPKGAEEMVNKIIAYDKKDAYGSWRNNVVAISDDAMNYNEFNSMIVHTDNLANNIAENKQALNVFKIHADAYQQESSAGGDRYPEVNEAINDAVEVGALVINYFGHGGEAGLAHERIVTLTDIQNWSNTNKYPLFVTVTCEFTRFDNPLHDSAGELVVTNTSGGAAGMISTTREISISDGKVFNNALLPHLFSYNNTNHSIAEALRKTKNSVSVNGKKNVMFFGDPAMKLAVPKPNIRLTKINDTPVEVSTDTLKALSKVKLSGQVVAPNGNLLSNYNGVLSVTIFDKEIERQTLGNDGVRDFSNNLAILDFTTLGEIIFRGQASVSNGEFEFEFVVPRDISIPVGTGRISFYAEKNNELEDQTGYNNNIKIGGINENAPEDNLGPKIQLYMNDENFVSGGITNSSPFILAHLEDENGINTASGIGHDIVAILDGDESNPFVLNDYYETELDDYTKGTTYYKLRDLEPGLHTLTYKAWDVYNNSSTAEIQFMVAEDEELRITKVLNYPNPFHNYTEFWFNHNRPFEPLEVQVQVFTVTGKVVWTQNQVINTDGFLSREIVWDGKDDFGDRLGKGVYVYKLTVRSTLSNKKAEKFEKLVIL